MAIWSTCHKQLSPIKIGIFISLVFISTQPLAHKNQKSANYHHYSSHQRHWHKGNYPIVTVIYPDSGRITLAHCEAWTPGYKVPDYQCSSRRINYDPPNNSSYGDDINADYNMTY